MTRASALRRMDWWVFLLAAALGLIGLTFVHSATLDRPDVADQRFKQALFLGCSLGLCLFLVLPHYRRVLRAAWPIYGLAVLALLGLPFFAPVINGAQRWYAFPGFSIQPSELAKPAVVVALAALLRFRSEERTGGGLLWPLLVAGVPALIVMRQPDLGSSLVYGPIVLAMGYAAGVPGRRILGLLGLGLLLAAVGYFFLHGYQRERIDVWLSHFGWSAELDGGEAGKPDARTRIQQMLWGSAYQPWQALIAMGGGGLTGFGLFQGPQNRHDFLPYRSEDYVFAVVGEEIGFVGCAGVLLLQGLLVLGILGIALRTRERFGRLLCVGVAAWLGSQTLIHAAVCAWMVPATGLPMPWISYGGSSTMAAALGLALCLNVSARREPVLAGDGFR